MAGRTRGGWWVGVAVLAGSLPVEGGESRAKVATTCSLASAGDRIRQRAFDGDRATAFGSAGPARAGDLFTLTFDAPAVVRSVAVESGRADGADLLDAGDLEVSADGTTFERAAGFGPEGKAHAAPGDRPLRALRVRVGRDLGHPLAIREWTIDSDRVKPFEHPVEFTARVIDAPEMQAWAEATARLCEQWYDALVDALPSEGFRPAERIGLTLRKDYDGVAEAGDGQITGSVAYFATHRDDQGAMIHETIHIIQDYRGGEKPGWLVEGVADYLRFHLFEPGKAGPVDPATAAYDGSYRTTGAFLDYLARTRDPAIVRKLNEALRAGTYRPELFEQLAGKPLEALNRDWVASLPPRTGRRGRRGNRAASPAPAPDPAPPGKP